MYGSLPFPGMEELENYLDSGKFVFCRTPEELRKEFEKFEWKKEVFMDETTKIIREIERKISGMTQHIVICIDELAVALKELMPKVIEKKETVLENGQIYRCQSKVYEGAYYLLIKGDIRWKLVSLQQRTRSWFGWRDRDSVKKEIENHFTLCPDVYIKVFHPLKTGGGL